MANVAVGGFKLRVLQFLPHGLLQHLHGQLLGKLLLTQSNALPARRQHGFNKVLILRAKVQLPHQSAHITRIQSDGQRATFS